MQQGARPMYGVQPGQMGGGGQGGAPHQAGGGHHEADVLRNLMINYIPTQVDEAYLRQMFEAYGPVESVKIVYDKENNMSKGYGFVKYRSPQSASLAINNLNGYPILNKRLKVAYAKPEDAQRMLQQMHVEGGGAMGAMGMPGQPGGAMDPQQMYYMQVQAQQAQQAQQLWLQQIQAVAAQGQVPQGAQPGANAMTPQQQQQMMMMAQQAQQQQQQPAPASAQQ